jgi:hypothetical protein
MLYVKNNPGSSIASTIDTLGKTYLKEPQNATYLKPFHRLANAAPKITTPNFALESLKVRVDKLAASIVDFPLELIMNRTGRSGGKENESAGSQFLKDRLNVESKYYEHIVRHMWWMSSVSFVKSTKEIIQALQENKAKEDETAESAKKRPKVTPTEESPGAEALDLLITKTKTNIYTLTLEELDAWNNIQVSFPKTPFLDMETTLLLYETGAIDEDQFMNYASSLFNLPKDKYDAERVKKSMDVFLKRKYGEATIELQSKLSAKEERLKEKHQMELQQQQIKIQSKQQKKANQSQPESDQPSKN